MANAKNNQPKKLLARLITVDNLYTLTWLQALVATLGSLFFSEVLKFPPCVLCWYQRIAVYPVVFIMSVAILRNDKNAPYYVLPLSVTGMIISIYHNLLYYKLLPEAAAPCVQGISCTTKFVAYFGFVTIPLMSLIALTVITFSMLLALKISNKKS